MNTFESRFDEYFGALGNAEQATIYNSFAEKTNRPQVFPMEMFDEMFAELSPLALIRKVTFEFRTYDNWFFVDRGNVGSIEILPEWIEEYIPAMAEFFSTRAYLLIGIDNKTAMLYQDAPDYARAKFEKMTLLECINLWNESACDHYCKFWAIHGMANEDWWNELAHELGAYDLIQMVKTSAGQFNDADEWFFYDVDDASLRSFNTKEELIDHVGEDFFIEHLTKEEE